MKAAVIVGNTPAVLAAVRVAGPTVPLVFVIGDDPVKSGLVASLNRPEGNLTGVTFFGGSLLGAKRLALLHELVPNISVVAVLLDPDTAFEIELIETAARALGLQIVPVKLASERDLDAAPNLRLDVFKSNADAGNTLVHAARLAGSFLQFQGSRSRILLMG